MRKEEENISLQFCSKNLKIVIAMCELSSAMTIMICRTTFEFATKTPLSYSGLGALNGFPPLNSPVG